MPEITEKPPREDIDAGLSRVEDAIVRIERRMESLATKEDVARMGSELCKDLNRLTRFLVVWTTTLCTALVAATFVIALRQLIRGCSPALSRVSRAALAPTRSGWRPSTATAWP